MWSAGGASGNSVALALSRHRLRFSERLRRSTQLQQNSIDDFMVLLNSHKRVSGLSRGQAALEATREAASIATLASVFFNLCEACISEIMASIPPSAFSAGRIRETQREMKVSNVKGNDRPQKYFNTKYMELSPLKYNSKLMNSIWGFYNRYSPHNVKKVCEDSSFLGETQQSAAVSSTKNEPVLNLPSQLDNMWAAINVSQSH